MEVIYEPKGRAREYAPLAANLYRGCTHGCRYCYAPQVLHDQRDTFHATAAPRKGVLEALEREAQRLAGDQRPVLLCFSTDPYQPLPEEHAQTTRRALEILRAHGLTPVVLSKGGLRAERDLDLLKAAGGWLGQSLTFLNNDDSRQWEPGAAVPPSRLGVLRAAARQGIRTWASLEPVVIPAQTLALVEASAPFVRHFKVGKLNYDAFAQTIDWLAFLAQVVDLLEHLGFRRSPTPGAFTPGTYYLKQDLLRAR